MVIIIIIIIVIIKMIITTKMIIVTDNLKHILILMNITTLKIITVCYENWQYFEIIRSSYIWCFRHCLFGEKIRFNSVFTCWGSLTLLGNLFLYRNLSLLLILIITFKSTINSIYNFQGHWFSSNEQSGYATAWYFLKCIAPYLILQLPTLFSICFMLCLPGHHIINVHKLVFKTADSLYISEKNLLIIVFRVFTWT